MSIVPAHYNQGSGRFDIDDSLEAHAAATIQKVIAEIARGGVSRRRAEVMREVFGCAGRITSDIVHIVRHAQDMVKGAATTMREIETCVAAADDCRTRIAENAAKRAELIVRANQAAAVIAEENTVRILTATLQATQLQQQIDALHDQKKQRESAPPPPAAQPGRFGTRIPDITDATLERLTSDATGIVREVQGGSIPTGIRQPYHAFAACLYLRARLDGEDSRAAAAAARDELVEQMLDGAEFSPSQIRAFVREHQDLKKRFDAQTEQQRGQSLLGSLHNLGVRAIPKNGNGAA